MQLNLGDKKRQDQILAILHQLLMAGYGFTLMLVLYRLSSREEAGRWVLFISSISLADMIMHGFFQTPLIRKISMEHSDRLRIDQITSNALILAFSIWLVLSASILILSLYFSSSGLLHDLRWYIPLGLVMIFFDIIWWVGNALLDFRAVLIQRIIFCVTSIGLIVLAFIHYGSLSLHIIALSQLAGFSLSAFIGIVFIRRLRFSYSHISWTEVRYFIDYGKYTAGSMVMGSILRNADVYMIGGFMGAASVALYSVAQKTVEIFEVPLRGMALHAFPEFCRFGTDARLMAKRFWSVTSRLLFAFGGALILIAIFAPQTIRLMSGSSQYSDATIILRIFMVYVLFLTVDRMIGVVLEALGLVKYNLAKTMLVAFVNISANFIALYYFHSLSGVAFGSILAAIAGILAGIYFFLGHSGLHISVHSLRHSLSSFLKWQPR